MMQTRRMRIRFRKRKNKSHGVVIRTLTLIILKAPPRMLIGAKKEASQTLGTKKITGQIRNPVVVAQVMTTMIRLKRMEKAQTRTRTN